MRVDLDDLAIAFGNVPDFMRDALCLEYPWLADAFFPERGESTDTAKELCGACLVQAECLTYALSLPSHLDHGIWGGTSGRERRKLRAIRG